MEPGEVVPDAMFPAETEDPDKEFCCRAAKLQTVADSKSPNACEKARESWETTKADEVATWGEESTTEEEETVDRDENEGWLVVASNMAAVLLFVARLVRWAILTKESRKFPKHTPTTRLKPLAEERRHVEQTKRNVCSAVGWCGGVRNSLSVPAMLLHHKSHTEVQVMVYALLDDASDTNFVTTAN